MHRKCKKIVALMMITSILSQNLPISIFAESIQNTAQKEVASSEESSQIKLDELLHDKTIFLGDSFDSLQDILPNELEKYPNIEVTKDDQSKIQHIVFNKETKDEFVVKVKSGEVDTDQAKEQKVLYEIKYKDGKTENIERTINVVDIKDRINFYKTYKDKDGKDQKYIVFTIGFDLNNNKLVVSNQNYSPIEEYPVDTVYSVIVLDKENKEKAKIELKGDYKSLSEGLSKLGDITLNAGDSINVKSYKAENTFEMIDTSMAFNMDEKSEQEKVFTLKDESVDGSQMLTLQEGQTEGSESGDNGEPQAPEPKLKENTITIKGIKFSDPGDQSTYLDERFKIKFDTENKKINITDRDGRIFSNVNEKYLEMVLYDKKGNIKQQLVLNGRDRSTDKRLDVFNNLAYEDGDYLYIWHKESESNFNIAGTVKSINGEDVPVEEGEQNGTPETLQVGDTTPTVPDVSGNKTENFTNGVPKEFTQDRTQYRFRLDSLNGLQLVKNEKPTISGLENMTTDRTQPVDLTKGLSISDDIDKTIESKNAIVDQESYNVDIAGEYNATLSVKDSWGLSSEVVRRKLTVNNTNDIDGIVIEVGTKSTLDQNAFKIGFDDVEKKFVFMQNENVDIDSSDTTDNFILSVYSKTGVLKKKFRFKGQDSLNVEAIEALSKYKYSSDDYISVWSKTPKNLKITGNITKGDKITEDSYADGIDDEDFMNNVRFHLSKGKFKAVYNDAPTINGTKNITIKRGQDPDFLENITVTDDHDNNIAKDKVKTNYKQGDNLVVQTKEIKYSVKDSWGREGTQTINLTVEPANNIEKNGIVFKVGNETMLKMEFDSLTDKFKYTYNEKIYREGNTSDIAFKLTLYNNNWKPIKELTINNEETITKGMIADLSSISMDDGVKIGVYAADKDSVSIYGDMIASKSKYENGFKNEESMKNTYFEIKDIGLKAIYNQEPVINFENNTEILVKENTSLFSAIRDFDPMDNVTAEDDIGIKTNIRKGTGITYTSNVKQSEIGKYTIIYTVTDILGRSTSVVRTVHVVPDYRDNTIVLEETDNNPLFKIGFNKLGTNFEVKYQEQVQQDSSPEATPQGQPQEQQNNSSEEQSQGQQSDPTVEESLDEEIFKIGIYGLKNEEIKTIKVSKNNLASLKELENTSLRSGYTISLWAKNHSKLKVNGNLEKDSKITEDYSTGISDVDFMDNVRFEINGSKLKAVYNEAPVISFARKQLDFYIGERTDFLEGVIFSDDKGTLNRETAKVYLNEKSLKEVERDDFTEPGDYKLIYEITDNWGRKAREIRTVKAKPGIERHKISFGAVDIKYSSETSTGYTEFTGLTLSIDHETKQIKLGERSKKPFLFNNLSNMYTIDILDKDTGNSKLDRGNITIKATDKGTDSKFDVLKNKQIEYGDKIKLTSTQGFRLKISGEMYNTGNNYEDGIISGDKLKRTEFVITPRGLEEVVTEPTYPNIGDNVYIEVYTNFDGSYMGKYVINTVEKKIEFDPTNGVSTTMDFRYNNKKFFKMTYYKSNGTQISGKSYEYKGNHNKNNFSSMNHTNFNDGDYIAINIFDGSKEYMPKLKIIGAKQGQIEFGDDFSDGIDDLEYLNNTRFVFKGGKLVAEYNKAPEIKGADDKDVLLNSGTFDLRAGVTVEDDRDNNLSATPNPGNISVDQENEQVVTYTTRDSWNRTTTKQRKINVRPGVFFNTIDVYKDGDTNEPIFTVGFDNKTNKYKATIHKEEQLAPHLETEDAFKMYIIGSNQQLKSTIDINGNKFVDNSIFEELNDLPYEEGDYIRVWRATPKESAPETDESNPTRTETNKQLIETLKINGNIENQEEDYSDGIEDLDHMNNVAFKVRKVGFESIYNQAPIISSFEEMTFYKSKNFTEQDLINKLTITDDYDNGHITLKVINPPDFNRVGVYDNVSFELTDKWGRSSLQTITVTIKSNILNNKIDIYSNSGEEKLYTISFADNGTMNVNAVSNNQSKSQTVFSMTIFNRFGKELKKVTFGANKTVVEEDLNSLNGFNYENNQYIQFKHTLKEGVRINGNVVNTSNDYQNGFAEVTEFDNTRFKITEDGLSEIKKTPLDKKIIKGLPPIIMVRGEEPDLLEGVTVEHPSETIATENIKIAGKEQLNKAGEHILTYSVTDSWGQTFSDERTVVVKPANMLEHNIIKVKNINNGGDVLEIGFDSLENKLTATQATRSSSLDNKFKLIVYDETGEVANTVSIESPTALPKAIEDINNIQIDEGYMLGLERTDYERGLEIEGKVKGDTLPKDENYEGVEKLEQILRLEINDEGLESVYNEEPKFEGLNTIDVEIGKVFDPLYGVKVMDTYDGQIDSSQVVIENELDITELGEQTLTYTVEDSWGRKTTQERTVWVISGSEKNSFDFYSKQSPSEKIFSLKIDSKNNQIKVETETQTEDTPPVSFKNRTGNESTTPVLDSDRAEENIVEIEVHSKAKIIKKLELKGNDGANSPSLKSFNGTEYKYGDMISITIHEPKNKSATEPYAKDIMKISGDLPKNDSISEDYKDGVDDMDFIDNVRFKINESNIEAIYNAAPVLKITNNNLTKDKSNELSDYGLLDGVTITDDHDDIPIENIVIRRKDTKATNSQDNIVDDSEDLPDIKTYQLEYQVVDTWGRKSDVECVTLQLEPTINKNILEFYRLTGISNTGNISTISKIKGFEIKFNHDTKKITSNVTNSGQLIFNEHDLYSIKIIGKDGDVKFNEQFGGSNGKKNNTSYVRNVNLPFEYGDKIQLTSNQGPVIRILGKVINPQEDYTDGTDFGALLKDTTFTITKNGLEASLSEQQKLPNDSIAYYAGINGRLSFNMEVDMASKRFKFTDIDSNGTKYYNEPLDTHDRRNTHRFTISYHKQNGDKYSREMNSNDTPQKLYEVFNERSFDIGDYITFKVADTRNRNLNLRLYGSIDKAKDDYAQGIQKDHLEEFNTARFYITKNGLEARYNEPPKITAPDMVIQLGQNFNTSEGLIVDDDYDERVEAEITGSVTPNKPGAYMLTYTATDSWGGKTVFDRFVIVQAPPEIEVVNETVIELNSMTQEEADQHIKENLVTVTDFEDGNLLHRTKISVRRLNPNAKSEVTGDTFDPSKEGTYEVTYTVTDNDENTVTKVVNLEVVKTIGVTVPLNNNVPFQVVTNLIKKPNESEPDPFISGTIKLKNNNLYNQIDVKVKSFTQKNKKFDSLQIVDPNQIDPNNMDANESMKKMALGVYSKQGSVSRNTSKEMPQWLTPGMESSGVIATIPKAANTRNPGETTLSFTSKHGKKFKGGTSRGKFDLILEFK